MATIVAQANGNWSNPATWTGGVVPGAGDIAQTGNYIVTIDASVTCTLNPTGSGYFVVTTGGITITGDVISQTSYWAGALYCMHNSGVVALTGTATGGAGNSSQGANNTGAGTLIVGTATGGTGAEAYGARGSGAGGTMHVDTAVGNNYGPGGSHSNPAPGVFGGNAVASVTTVKNVQSGPYGQAAVAGSVLILDDIANSAQFRKALNGATKTLTDAAATADFPAVSDVRYGVEYNYTNLVGTAHIPAAANVALGIPVDATVGTAVLTAAAVTAGVWDAARSGHAGAGTFGATDEWTGSVDEAAIAAAVLAALEGSPITVICINPERSEDSDYDILRNNASNC